MLGNIAVCNGFVNKYGVNCAAGKLGKAACEAVGGYNLAERIGKIFKVAVKQRFAGSAQLNCNRFACKVFC